MTSPSVPRTLAAALDRWVAAGLITSEQAERIRAAEAAAPTAPGTGARSTSLVTEALGYLGGVIVTVGLGLVIGRFWDDLSSSTRVALTGAVAVLLLLAGIAVPSRLGPPGVRLRSVLWLGASSALFAAVALYTAESLDWSGNQVVLAAGGATTVVSAVLWVLNGQVLQQASVLVSVLLALGATAAITSDVDRAPLIAIWLTGVVWFALAWFTVFKPRDAGLVLGAVAAIIGAIGLVDSDLGSAVAGLTVLGLTAVAVQARDLALLVVSSIGVLIVLTMITVRYFPGVLGAAVALVVVGLLLVGVAVIYARRRSPRTS